jgi:hypothetical protein
MSCRVPDLSGYDFFISPDDAPPEKFRRPVSNFEIRNQGESNNPDPAGAQVPRTGPNDNPGY